MIEALLGEENLALTDCHRCFRLCENSNAICSEIQKCNLTRFVGLMELGNVLSTNSHDTLPGYRYVVITNRQFEDQAEKLE